MIFWGDLMNCGRSFAAGISGHGLDALAGSLESAAVELH